MINRFHVQIENAHILCEYHHAEEPTANLYKNSLRDGLVLRCGVHTHILTRAPPPALPKENAGQWVTLPSCVLFLAYCYCCCCCAKTADLF